MIYKINKQEIISKISSSDIEKYLQKMSWRQSTVVSHKFSIWLKKSGYDEDFEVLVPLNTNSPDFDRRLLELIETLTISERKPAEEIINKIGGAKLYANEENREIIDFHINPSKTERIEPLISTFGNFLHDFQSILDSIGQYKKGITSLKGKIPESIKSQTQMSLLNTFEGSLGIRLIASREKDPAFQQFSLDYGLPELGEKPLLVEAISEFIDLIKVTKEVELLKEKLTILKSRSANSYQRFLEQLVSIEGESIYLDWGSNYPGGGGSAELTQSDAMSAISAISETITSSEEELTVRVKIIGINLNAKKEAFEISSIGTNEPYQGKISQEAIKQIEGMDISFNKKIYLARIKETIKIKQSTGEGIPSHILLSIQPI
jgi:hypothetical protein